jgi:hypothetical protein
MRQEKTQQIVSCVEEERQQDDEPFLFAQDGLEDAQYTENLLLVTLNGARQLLG